MSDHFTSKLSLMPIGKVPNSWKRLLKETIWMHVLGTISPKGLNS